MSSKRTDQLDRDRWITKLIKRHVRVAELGQWDGKDLTPYFESCREQNHFRGLSTVFTRDTGYHTSGWWKNPDYERCYHLSISFFDPATLGPAKHESDVVRKLIKGFYGRHAKWVWVEPPYSRQGKQFGVWHYRLFCDAGWKPIKPRGEVYGKELTEAGWHSYSDVQHEL